MEQGEREELEMLRERLRWVESIDEAEKVAIIRTLQELSDILGLGEDATPRSIIERVWSLVKKK